MHQKKKDIQLHYEGFVKTPYLWTHNTVYDLDQFTIQQEISSYDQGINTHLRLGKYVERFVSDQLSKMDSVQIVAENVQIQEGKMTLGEIDFLILENERPVHIEVIYKFYLYDTLATHELRSWIGPNRKDSLIEKLDKLRSKQLPLLHTEACRSFLAVHNLTPDSIEQSVYFKAQLFVPYATSSVQFSALNEACVVGFYLYRNERAQFKNCKFYIPSKKDWLIIPHTNVTWLSFEDFCKESDQFLARKFSPMCWMKFENGALHKFFLVWWMNS